MVIDLYRCIVAEFVASHHLYVKLYGAGGYAFSDSLKVVKGIGAGIDKVLQRPTALTVAEAVVDGLISE